MRNYLPLIVEGDALSSSILSSLLQKIPFLEVPIICKTGLDTLKVLKQMLVDVLFPEMHLPDFAGEELLKMPPKRRPTIITTTDPNFAFSCYDCDVADYLMKPLAFQRCVRVLNRAPEMRVSDNNIADAQSIFLKVSRQLKQFHLKDIDYAGAFGTYSKLFSHQQVTVVNEAIASLKQRLPKRYFSRVQKSYIINMEK